MNPVPCLEPVVDGWPIHHPERCGEKSAGLWWGFDWPECPAVAIEADSRIASAIAIKALGDMGRPLDMTEVAAWVPHYVMEVGSHQRERRLQQDKGRKDGPAR